MNANTISNRGWFPLATRGPLKSGVQALEKRFQHARRRSPDHVVVDGEGGGAEGDSAADQPALGVARSQLGEAQLNHLLDLGGLGGVLEARRHQPHERHHFVAGDDGRGGLKRPDDLDRCGVEPDLLLALPQGAVEQALVAFDPAAGKGDLPGVAPQIMPALGEDEARIVGPVEDRDQDGGVLGAVGVDRQRLRGREQEVGELAAQMITWTVPPSTPQAEPWT